MRTRLERPIRRKLDYELRLFTSDEERDDDDDDLDGTSKIAKYTEFFFAAEKGGGRVCDTGPSRATVQVTG